MKKTVAVIGAGSWGTALAIQLANKGYNVKMWARNENIVNTINEQRENIRYLPGVNLPKNLTASTDLPTVLAEADAVLYSVPSHAFRETLVKTLPSLPENAVIINAAKGIEEDSLKRMSEVFSEEAGSEQLNRYVVLSGPSHAEEVGLSIPTAIVAASKNMGRAEYVQDLFTSNVMRIYTNPDVVGVELGGALKNIIALATGIADGLQFGDNTKAALMTRGLAEITRLGVAMGAMPLTFAGLSGLGDLIVTCTSMHSRNRRAGIEIGKGKTLEQALSSVQMVVEGVRTTKAAKTLAARLNIEMPITEHTYKVLYENYPPREAVMDLMGRSSKPELEEVALVKWNPPKAGC